MNKKIWMVLFVCLVSSCAIAQTKMDKLFGEINSVISYYEKSERLFHQIKSMRPVKKSAYGTIICKQYARPLKSLTWSSLQIERQGPYLYVYEVEGDRFAIRDRLTLTISESGTYDCYVLQNGTLYQYNVVVQTMGRKGYVYFRDGTHILENYTFDDK